jgi:hypothetical protein
MPPSVPYLRCPKCHHQPLPADQSLPATCPGCGLVLAKFGAAPPPRIMSDEDSDEASPVSHWRTQLVAAVTHVPAKVDPTRFWIRVVLLAGFAFWGMRLIALDVRSGELGESFLHGPLLVFHEAGHMIFMILGEFIMIAGGTLGQLIMPAILCGALLLKNRDAFGAAIGLWLFGVSLLDIAPYAYDALHPQLTLLGGHTGEQGGHDWMFLLGKLGLIQRAQGIGWLIHKLGALVILLSMYWAGWQLWQQRRRLATHAVLEEES